jgi:hypothetical protein
MTSHTAMQQFVGSWSMNGHHHPRAFLSILTMHDISASLRATQQTSRAGRGDARRRMVERATRRSRDNVGVADNSGGDRGRHAVTRMSRAVDIR